MVKYMYQYKYHYNKVYPIEYFINNEYKRKDKRLMKYEKNLKINNCESFMNNKNIINNESFIDKYIGKNNIYENKSKCLKKFERLKKNYYNNYKYENNGFFENMEFINFINKSNCDINLFHANLIYTYYEIYNKISNNNNSQVYEIKEEFKLIKSTIEKYYINVATEDTLLTFFKKIKKCYNFVNNITCSNINNEIIIKLFSMCNLTIDILYKLNDESLYNFKMFLKEKYLFNCKYDNNIPKIKYINIKEKHDPKIIKNICNDIPISYLGCKRNSVNKIISKISFSDNINTFIDLFGGSLCVSYVVKTLFPNIKIIIYENNKLITNFYCTLKNNYKHFITRLINILEEIKIKNNKKEYIENIVNKINNELNKVTFSDKILMACYFYILNKVSYLSILKYTKEGNIKVTINQSRIDNLLKFGNIQKNKLHKYSVFLNNVTINNLDVTNNYKKIIGNINENTITYVDPPYDSDNNGYKNYQNDFTQNNHMSLKNFLQELANKGYNWIKSNNYTGFISELYSGYSQCILKLKERITNINKKEILITNF